MSTQEKEFTRKDLLQAWLEVRNGKNADTPEARHHRKVYSALSQAFHIDLQHLPADGPERAKKFDQEILHHFFEMVAQNRAACSSPFAGLMEAPDDICRLYQSYGEPFRLIQKQSHTLHDKLLLELMEKIWGITESQKVTQATLDACGYPQEPAPEPFIY